MERAKKLAEALRKPNSFLSKYGRAKPGVVGWKVFDLLNICATRKEMVNHLDVPDFLRPHWTKFIFSYLRAAYHITDDCVVV